MKQEGDGCEEGREGITHHLFMYSSSIAIQCSQKRGKLEKCIAEKRIANLTYCLLYGRHNSKCSINLFDPQQSFEVGTITIIIHIYRCTEEFGDSPNDQEPGHAPAGSVLLPLCYSPSPCGLQSCPARKGSLPLWSISLISLLLQSCL